MLRVIAFTVLASSLQPVGGFAASWTDIQQCVAQCAANQVAGRNMSRDEEAAATQEAMNLCKPQCEREADEAN